MENKLYDKTIGAVASQLRYHLFTKKMGTPVGVAVLALIALAVSYLTVLVDMKASIGIVAGAGALILCAVCIVYPVVGFYSAYVVSLFSMFPERLMNSGTPLPTGLIPEYMGYLAMLGVLTKQQYRKEITSKFWSHALTAWMLLMLMYHLLQVVNPEGASKLGWFNFVRKQISFISFFYVSYCIFNTRKAIFYFTRFWIVLATIEALYTCKQQWFGFFNFEYQWLMADPKRIDLFINYGFVRRFGLLSDPAAAGILYACSTVMLVGLALSARKLKDQAIYFLLAIVHFLATSYTGTRTGTLMIVAGIAFYCILNLYEKRTRIFIVLFAFGFTALMVAPIYDNMIINRLRSTFEGSKDPSALTRDLNRKIAQPYVYSHPIGGGLNSSGLIGSMYNPGHYLTSIPPDSGYMQTMMEQGAIGLLLLCTFYFLILRTGIKYYYQVRAPQLKSLYAAHLVAVFTMLVAQYSQLAIGQYPSVLYFYSVLAMFLKLHQYDLGTPASSLKQISHE